MTNDKNDLLSGTIELVVDPVDEALEELALLGSAWLHNRDKKRPSPILRRVLIDSAREMLKVVDEDKKRPSPILRRVLIDSAREMLKVVDEYSLETLGEDQAKRRLEFTFETDDR